MAVMIGRLAQPFNAVRVRGESTTAMVSVTLVRAPHRAVCGLVEGKARGCDEQRVRAVLKGLD